jgi:hypothetical protein
MKKLAIVTMLTFTSIGLAACGSEETSSPSTPAASAPSTQSSATSATSAANDAIETVQAEADNMVEQAEASRMDDAMEEAETSGEELMEAVNDQLNGLLN